MFLIRLIELCKRIESRLYSELIRRGFHTFGRGANISPPFRFSNLQWIALGPGATVNRDCWLVTLPLPGEDSNECKLSIGAGASVGMGATISAARRVQIDENVLLARNVYISDHGHAFEDISRPIQHQGISEPRPVKIGRNTWLGQNVCVLPGVTIGEHCVVGANSVVLSNLPDYSIAVGSPARVVKRYDPVSKTWKKIKPAAQPIIA